MFAIFLVFGLANLASGNNVYTEKTVANFDQLSSWIHLASAKVFPYFEEAVSGSNLTLECSTALRSLLQHPGREWSAFMLDASGRLVRPGLLSGTITDYGDYYQCMAIKHLPDPELGQISSRYCLLSLRPPIPPPGVDLHLHESEYRNTWIEKHFSTTAYRMYGRIVSAVCFPSVCEPTEMESLFRKSRLHFRGILILILFGIVFESLNVQTELDGCQVATEQTRLDFAQIISALILASCIGLVVIGTFLDECCCSQFWKCFSFSRNTRALFAIHQETKEGGSKELSPIHGLRVLLILWVILCHTSNFAPLGLYDQPMIVARLAKDILIAKEFLSQFLISGSLAVQAFFVISGLLSMHTALKNREQFRKSVTYWKYLLLRWVRFSPPLLGMLCYQFLWPLLISGPMAHWDYLRLGHEPCYKRWYTNFLFISNWYPLVDQCGSHTWFLSADFQINLLAYFVIAVYVRNYSLGVRVNIAALVIASIIPTVFHFYYQVPLVHILEQDLDKLNHTFNMIEFNTFNHFTAYLAGILLAALINRPLALSNASIRRNWILSMIILLVIPFSTYPFIQMEQIQATFLSLAYTGIKRVLFVAAFSWTVYACCTCSTEGPIARLLSAGVFQPFSRLTFCIYLTQSLVVWIYAYSSPGLHFLTHFNTLFRVGGVILFSTITAFLLHILLEAPSVNLCRLLLKKADKIRE